MKKLIFGMAMVGLTGCGTRTFNGLSQTAGTGAQDPEVASLRLKFASTASQRELTVTSNEAAVALLTTYQCNERSATLDSQEVSTFPLAFTKKDDYFANPLGAGVKVTRLGLGSVREWTGFPMVPGELQTVLFVRTLGDEIIGERALVPAVARVSTSGAAHLAEVASQHEASIGDGSGFALSYVSCPKQSLFRVLQRDHSVEVGFDGLLRTNMPIDGIRFVKGTAISFDTDGRVVRGTLRDDQIYRGIELLGETRIEFGSDGSFSGFPKGILTTVMGATTFKWAPGKETSILSDGRATAGTFVSPQNFTIIGKSALVDSGLCLIQAARLDLISGTVWAAQLADTQDRCNFSCWGGGTSTFRRGEWVTANSWGYVCAR